MTLVREEGERNVGQREKQTHYSPPLATQYLGMYAHTCVLLPPLSFSLFLSRPLSLYLRHFQKCNYPMQNCRHAYLLILLKCSQLLYTIP